MSTTSSVFAHALTSDAALPLVVEAHERVDPAWTVEIGPLIAHAQMDFDDAASDGFDVDDAGIALQMLANPCAAIVLDAGIASGVNRPMLERAFSGRLAGDVPPPVRLALDDRDVRADMAALQERHPHV